VVVITGASSGIGKASAIKFAKKNAKVVLVARRREKLLQVQKEISQYTDSTLVCQCDVSNNSQVKELTDTVIDTFGRFDILVNNAIFPDQQRPFFETDEIYWDRMMDLSLKGYFFASQRAAKEMLSGGTGGRIICLSSVHSYVAMPNWTAYGTAKMALRRMVKGIAADLAGKNITANCIAPGAISNKLPDIEDDSIDGPPHNPDDWKKFVPSGKGGLPSDIANAVLYLSSDLGQYVNGETLLVDGGMIASQKIHDQILN